MFGATSPNFCGFNAKGPPGAPMFVRLGDHEANLYGSAGQVMEHPPVMASNKSSKSG